ncbi:MAG: D-beta-hydroxybutyrate dehydrogenase, partial [uncultured Ramlibacter sp.]
AQRKNGPGHRVHQRHRAWHRQGPGQEGRAGRAQRFRRHRGGPEGSGGGGRRGRLPPGRHEQAGRDRGHDEVRSVALRPGRRAGQQRRHPARVADRGLRPGALGCGHRHQPVERVPHHAPRDPRDAPGQLGPHPEHRIRARIGRLAGEERLCRRQARHRRPDQDRGLGVGHDGRDVQCNLPGLGADPAGAEADRGACRQRQDFDRAGQARPAGREAALAAVHHARRAGRAVAVPVLHRRQQRARRRLERGRGLGRSL